MKCIRCVNKQYNADFEVAIRITIDYRSVFILGNISAKHKLIMLKFILKVLVVILINKIFEDGKN